MGLSILVHLCKYERVHCLLERLGQEEALLHVVVRRVGGVDVLHPGETSAHPAVLIDGLEGVIKSGEERGEEISEEKRKRARCKETGKQRKRNKIVMISEPQKQRIMK